MHITLTLPHGTKGDAVAAALDLPDVTLRRAALTALDAKPVLMALQAPGLASYLFHGVTPNDAGDIAATLRAYVQAPRGWIIDARACGRLRLCLKTRIPGG